MRIAIEQYAGEAGCREFIKAKDRVCMAPYTTIINGRKYCDAHRPDREVRVRKANRVRCNQCEALSINGIFCHETGCPNQNARFDAKSGTWIKQAKCFVCGCTVDANDLCCDGNDDYLE